MLERNRIGHWVVVFWLSLMGLTLGACGSGTDDDAAAGACKNVRCESGVCESGVCVNKDVCTSAADCLPDYACGADSKCTLDVCEALACERGLCSEERGQCINDGVCTIANEQTACLEGHYCYDNSCVSEAALCEELGCEAGRGVCDPEARACVNATDCGGDDSLCLAQHYCNEDNVCELNLCMGPLAECARGVCEASTGTCQNRETCADNLDCVDDHYCMAGSCVETTAACADCTGNQRCVYEAQSQAVHCEEKPAGCVDARDCLGERVCSSGICSEPVACVPDMFEPNEDPADAVDLQGYQELQKRAVSATMCSGDRDMYRYDTRGHGLTRGQLIVQVRYARADVGLGGLEVQVVNSRDVEVARGTTGADGLLTLDVAVAAHELGEYFITVREANGESGAVGIQGAGYSIFADFRGREVSDACEAATELVPGTLVGNTRTRPQYGLGMGCTSGGDLVGGNVYWFDLTKRSHVDLQLTSVGSESDLGLSLRQPCQSALGELVCANEAAKGGSERIRTTLDAGRYFVVVQGNTAATGGDYKLDFRVGEVICHPGESTCSGSGTSRMCRSDGTGFSNVTCSMGCNSNTGLCTREPGDACYTAIDASAGYSGTIDWLFYQNDVDPGAESCLENNQDSGSTAGADVAYVVNLPAGHSLQARLRSPVSYNSLYLVSDCSEAADSCRAGSNTVQMHEVDEYLDELVYHNASAQMERLYVIADSGPSLITALAHIDIQVGVPSCEPGDSMCGALGREDCGAAGIRYELTRPCPFGCDDSDASCAPVENNTCKGAVDIVAWGGTFTGLIDDYVDSYNPGAGGCTGRGAPGKDAVFVLDAAAGDIITATIQSQFNASLWIMTDCSRAATSCIAGSDRYDNERGEELSLIAPHDGRYYLVVDGAANNRGQFTLSVDVQTPSCEPGSVLGCTDGQTLSYCNDRGLPIEHTCTTSCEQNRCAEPGGDTCVDALPVLPGQTVTGNFRGTATMNPGLGVVNTCNFGNTEGLGPETVYTLTLEEGQRLTVDVESESSATIVYLLKSCSVQQSCLANTSEGRTQRLEYDAVADETIYIVVDRTRPSSSQETFVLTASVQTRGCVPGSVQCFGPENLGLCDGEFLQPYRCDGGCQDDRCVNPRGAICQDPIVLASGMSVTGNWAGTPEVNPGEGESGTCDFGDVQAVGNDTIYAVDLAEGDVLHAILTTSASTALLYLMGDCLQQDSCRVAAPHGAQADAGELYYVAAQAERVYLVVDRTLTGSLTTTYTLAIDIEPSNCAPHSVQCAADGKTLEVCDPYGLKTDYSCTSSCSGGQCSNPSGAHCLEARPLYSGDSIEDRLDGANTQGIGSGRHGACQFGTAPAGSDRVYAIAMQAGQRLDAFLQARDVIAGTPSTMLMYLMSDCSQAQSCMAQTASGDRGRLEYLAPEDTTVYLVVGRTDVAAAEEWFTLDIKLQTPGCAPGTAVCLNEDVLGVCDDAGEFLRPYECDDGCTGGRCGSPRGEICQDAQWLPPGTSQAPAVVTGALSSGTTNSINPGTQEQGLCSFGTSDARGPDRIYAVEVQAGEVLLVTLQTTDSSALLYLLEDCALPGESCLANRNGTHAQIYYEATTAKTLYIVVDRTSQYTTTAVYTLQVSVETPSCVPGETECLDAQTLATCNTYGLPATHVCSGGCANDACVDGDGDSCVEAIDASGGGLFTGDFTGTSAVNPGRGAAGACDFGSSEMVGSDTIYAVDLQAGDILRANLQTTDYGSALYIMQDCSVSASCLAQRSSSGELSYQAEHAQRVFVVVDRLYSFATTATYTLDLWIQQGLCTGGHMQCAADGQTLEICGEDGLYERYLCDGGCTNASCDTPRGDICQDAVVLTHGDIVQGDWLGTNAINPGQGSVGACQFGSSQSNGSEKIYAIHVQAGEILEARLETAHTSALLYVLEDCNDAQSCLAHTEKIGPQTLRWQAPSSGQVFLVVDARSNSSQNTTFTLSVALRSQECVPGTTQCASDGATLEICDVNGLYDAFACQSTCSFDRCDEPSGDICEDAIRLYHGDTFSGNFANFTNRHNPGTLTCMFGKSTSQHEGRDAVFAIDLMAGQLLEATLTTTAYNASMYVLDGCDRPASESCIYANPSSNQSLKFYADQSQTYYLVVDAISTAYTNDFDLRVDVHDYQAICQPGGVRCDVSSGVLTQCNDDGTIIEEQATCAYGCGLLGCKGPEPANSACSSAYLITGSTLIVDELSRFSNDFQYTAQSCVNTATPGKDAVYRVRLRANEVLVARVRVESILSSLTASIVRDCSQPEATCQTGSSVTSYGGGEVVYRSNGTEDVFLLLDASNAAARGQYMLEVDIFEAECAAGEPQCYGNVLHTCDNYGRLTETPCYYGCDDNACLSASNNTCENALDATGGLQFTGNMGDFTANYSPAGGTCSGLYASTSSEAVFYVDAEAFDRILVQQHSAVFDSVLWVSQGCDQPQRSCVAGADRTGYNSAETLDFVVPEAGRYFIFADSYSGQPQGMFTLDVEVIPAVCTPLSAACIDDQTLGICKADRSGYEPYACNGGCANDACGQPRGDICADSVDASGGEFFGTFENLQALSSPPFGGCTGFEALGPEAFYAVELEAGQTVTATLSNISGTTDLSLYILGACGQSDTCLAGSDRYGSISETTQYTATIAETVYVVADSYDPDSQGEYRLFIEIQ